MPGQRPLPNKRPGVVRHDRSGMTIAATFLPGMILSPIMSQASGLLEVVDRLLKSEVPVLAHIGFTTTALDELVDRYLRAIKVPRQPTNVLWGIEQAQMPDLVLRLAARSKYEARFIIPMLRNVVNSMGPRLPLL